MPCAEFPVHPTPNGRCNAPQAPQQCGCSDWQICDRLQRQKRLRKKLGHDLDMFSGIIPLETMVEQGTSRFFWDHLRIA